MSSQGATMQNYMTDLIHNLESMKNDRNEIQDEINDTEKHRKEIEENIQALSTRLQELNESLKKKTELRSDYDANIQEMSSAFTKILESSQTLLHVAKKESNTLEKKKEKVMFDENKSAGKGSHLSRHESENNDNE